MNRRRRDLPPLGRRLAGGTPAGARIPPARKTAAHAAVRLQRGRRRRDLPLGRPAASECTRCGGKSRVRRMDPPGLRMDPLGLRMDPLGRRMDPLGLRMDPLGRRMDPLRRRMDPLGRRMDPLGRRMDPLRRRMEKMRSQMEPLVLRMDLGRSGGARQLLSSWGRGRPIPPWPGSHVAAASPSGR
jgi:hypothetical protein